MLPRYKPPRYGTSYNYRDFCDVNLVDHGYGVRHASGYHGNGQHNNNNIGYHGIGHAIHRFGHNFHAFIATPSP